MIYEHADSRRLAWARISILAFWLWQVESDPFEELAALPREWFEPNGLWLLAPTACVDMVWNHSTLLLLKAVTLCCVSLALAGAPRPRIWAIASAILLTIVTAFVRGFGHVDHGHVQLLLVTYVLAGLPAWDAHAFSARNASEKPAAVYRSGFVALALVFAFPYLATGAYRLAKEGTGIFLGQSILHFLARDTLSQDHFAYTHGLWLVQHGQWLPLYNLAFFGVTAAELFAPFSHLRRRPCIMWLTIILPFHLLSPWLMHIFFGPNVVLVVVLYACPLFWKERAPRSDSRRLPFPSVRKT